MMCRGDSMKQYIDFAKHVLENGIKKGDRTGTLYLHLDINLGVI